MHYEEVSQNIGLLPDFIEFYQNELITARKEIRIFGNLEQNLAQLPGITETRFSQLQEIESVLEFLNIQLRKLQRKWLQHYMEKYDRALTSREAEKFASGESEVLDYETIINSVALLRNQYLSIMKGLESKNFMIGHLTRLKVAGMEDTVIR